MGTSYWAGPGIAHPSAPEMRRGFGYRARRCSRLAEVLIALRDDLTGMFNQTRRDADHSSSVITGTTGIFPFGQICPNGIRRLILLERRQLALFGLLFKQRLDRRGSNQYQVKGELPVNSPEAAGKETREIAAQKAGSA